MCTCTAANDQRSFAPCPFPSFERSHPSPSCFCGTVARSSPRISRCPSLSLIKPLSLPVSGFPSPIIFQTKAANRISEPSHALPLRVRYGCSEHFARRCSSLLRPYRGPFGGSSHLQIQRVLVLQEEHLCEERGQSSWHSRVSSFFFFFSAVAELSPQKRPILPQKLLLSQDL